VGRQALDAEGDVKVRAIHIVALCALATAVAASAQDTASHNPPSPSAAGYVPGLGEIMSLQQMRHAKLWLAGSQKNWPLAAYELDELREGFEDVQKLYPTHEGVPVGAMAASLAQAPLQGLDKAIEAKDGASFRKSFDQLTQACNTCHRAAQHAFIVIARPSASPFPNQKFAPAP
jgi:hypothetical protein